MGHCDEVSSKQAWLGAKSGDELWSTLTRLHSAKLGEPVIEINRPPNRQDCTGVHGIARDLAAADMGKFKDPGIKQIKGEFPCPVKVTVEDATLCPGFALRLVRGVRNGPSPEWLQKRLTSIGLRPINALVDITNYLTLDSPRPLPVLAAATGTGHAVCRLAPAGAPPVAWPGHTDTPPGHARRPS